MSWRVRTDEPKYPKGFPESMDRDGGLYNAWWQRGGNQIAEFIEKEHMYRAKFSAPPEWIETKPFKDVDKKFAKLQLLKNTDFRKKIGRRKMLSTEKREAGGCSVLSDGSDDSPSRVRTSAAGQAVPSAVLGSGGSSSVSELMKLEEGATVSPEELARRKSTREAANDRRFYKERGSKGTYKFGQEPTAEDLKYLNRTQDERTAAGKSGTYRFDDKCTEDYSQKWAEKPANALADRVPPESAAAFAELTRNNQNDPKLLNEERRVLGKKTEHKIREQDEERRRNNTNSRGSSTQSTRKLPSAQGITVDVAQELWYLDPLPEAAFERSTSSTAPNAHRNAKKKKKSDSTQLLPGALDAEAWVKPDLDPERASATTTNLRGSAKYTQHIKVPKHLRREMMGMKKGGPLLPYKALQRLTTYSDLDYSLLRTDLQEEVKKTGEIKQYFDRHPYFRKGQRSRFYNNSNRVAELVHAGAAENFPGWDSDAKQYPGYPFYNEEDGRERDPLRKHVGEDTFAAWDKPLISEPKERQFSKPTEKMRMLEKQLLAQSQPISDAFPPDHDSDPDEP
ncbi:unnamed protein product [Amoebophrya sp. A120]|nr:unnamed protein product [Amoebophrya sp. A120]|eukprot:GSA120T00017335001.1